MDGAAKEGSLVIGSDQPIHVQSTTTSDAPALTVRGLSISIPLSNEP
ncbi:MAG: hypothetical protein JNL94_08760 [Planctomycetes bacterium]|nr:hypothetical protein [Planctomycetota bacterium]